MPITRPTLSKLAERGGKDHYSPVETYAPDGSSIDRKHFTTWNERFTAVAFYTGYSQIARVSGPGSAPVRLERLNPLRHPDREKFYAKKVGPINGFKALPSTKESDAYGGAWANRFSLAELTVSYEPVPYPIEEDSESNKSEEFRRHFWLSSMSPSAEMLTLPVGGMTYRTPTSNPVDGLPIPYGQNVVVPLFDIEWVWDALPLDLMNLGDPLANRIFGKADGSELSMLGTLNKYPWPGPNGFPSGSLLLTEYRPVPQTSALGVVSLRVHIKTVFKPSKGGWNWLRYADPKRVNSGYYYVTNKTAFHPPGSVPDDESLYNERDFSLLTKVQA